MSQTPTTLSPSLAPLDDYRGALPPMNGPYVHAWNITPSDVDPLPRLTNAVRVVAAGNVRAIFAGDRATAAAVTIPVSAGELLQLRLFQVLASGTTATLVGLA